MADGGASAPQPARLRLEVADIFRSHGAVYQAHHAMSDRQRKVMRAIVQCRTAVLGGHLDVCTDCGYSRPSYNSCRDRHCPKCQSLRQAQWLEQRRERLLPVPYFHVVFTLPEKLRPVCRRNDREMYNLLFSAASQTLLRLGADPKWLGGRLAFTAVLHTWTRELHYHPHLHCIVAAGALSEEQTRWIAGSTRYLFPVAVLSALFRGLFLDGLKKLCERDEVRLDGRELGPLLESLYGESWVVYIKRPFGGPEQVYRYLGRYTHRVGISNQRLVSMDESGVCFVTKGDKRITISAEEFIRRFLLHVLPQGFTKTRHYGLLASGRAQQGLAIAQALLFAEREANAPRPAQPQAAPLQAEEAVEPDEQSEEEAEAEADGEVLAERILRLCGIDLIRCPACHVGRMSWQPLPQSSQHSLAGPDTS